MKGHMKTFKDLLPWLHYPVVMSFGLALFAILQFYGVSPRTNAYISILSTAFMIMLLEFKFPYRSDWYSSLHEVKTDLMFIGLVQLALPPLISFTVAYWLVGHAPEMKIHDYWPHHWSIWSQAILMIVVVDFLLYWLHRAAHNNRFLWRLHSVHHSVEQLYWLNTSRFHPLEKVLQMLCDSIPFILLGVSESVLALYYIAYATNGFFQHSNIHLRFGWLNYILGTAELHRWHHARNPEESNHNYGNNIIIWDVIFGSWYLPKNRHIKEIGLNERDYPKTFLGQIFAPFDLR